MSNKKVSQYLDIEAAIDCNVWDGVVAMMRVVRRMFGEPIGLDREGMFGPVSASLKTIETSLTTSETVIWGDFKVPGLDGNLSGGYTRHGTRYVFELNGSVRPSEESKIAALVEAIKTQVREHSIYKGKAIKLEAQPQRDFDPSISPKYIDVSEINLDALTFNEDIRSQIQNALFTPLEHTEACRANNIPLKRGILLEGPYGTGKTLTALAAAKKAVDNGWTFIQLERVAGLRDAYNLAKEYTPCVLFAEDIDRSVAGERTVKMDDALNTLDGLDSKNTEIITVLTSNHVDDINRAMLRPGRLDTIIHVDPPNTATAERLVRYYGKDVISPTEDLSLVANALCNKIPAVIREVVNMAKLQRISSGFTEGSLRVTAKDLANAVEQMQYQLKLLNTLPPGKDIDKQYAEAQRQIMSEACEKWYNGR